MKLMSLQQILQNLQERLTEVVSCQGSGVRINLKTAVAPQRHGDTEEIIELKHNQKGEMI